MTRVRNLKRISLGLFLRVLDHIARVSIETADVQHRTRRLRTGWEG